jgi:hypothetical protein
VGTSAHPRKRRVVLSQLPHVLWASGCWHYERTLYSRRPLKGTGVSIYLSIYLSEWELSEGDAKLLFAMKLVSPQDLGSIVHPDIIHINIIH